MSHQPPHNLTLIPGPIEFADDVLQAMSHYSVAHTAQPFVDTFQSALKSLRTLFFNKDLEAQPFVIAGSGTLGWDISAANFLTAGDDAIVLNTGFFSSSWGNALRAYGINVTELQADVGDVVPFEEIEKTLKAKKFKAITITHVDTSTAVVSDVEKISKLVREVSPDTLIFVDGVCSVGVEPLKFDEWKLDYVLTASQKAIGVPAGLHISIASKRALDTLANRKTPVPGFFHNLERWLPIMKAYESGKPAYFATPAVQTVWALKTSLDSIATSEEALEKRFSYHAAYSDKVKDTLHSLGLKLIAKNRDVAAHGLTAAFLPDDWELPNLLKPLVSDGYVIAGGILPNIASRYFRIGHMGVSLEYGHIDRLLSELKSIFRESSL